jgi:hypothetical protein
MQVLGTLAAAEEAGCERDASPRVNILLLSSLFSTSETS